MIEKANSNGIRNRCERAMLGSLDKLQAIRTPSVFVWLQLQQSTALEVLRHARAKKENVSNSTIFDLMRWNALPVAPSQLANVVINTTNITLIVNVTMFFRLFLFLFILFYSLHSIHHSHARARPPNKTLMWKVSFYFYCIFFLAHSLVRLLFLKVI